MIQVNDIIDIAIAEHDNLNELPSDREAFRADILSQLESPSTIPNFQHDTKPLSLVTFTCMLQDTGYPMEVYQPPSDRSANESPDGLGLEERWIGWAVQVPGVQSWTGWPICQGAETQPKAVQAKFPLPDLRNQHLGAMLKIYQDVSFKPASTLKAIGVVTTSFLPFSDEESLVAVPAIHVLRTSDAAIDSLKPQTTQTDSIRDSLVDLLSSVVHPKDPVTGEFLLLLLLSHPLSRNAETGPLGTLSINLMSHSPTSSLVELLGLLNPLVVTLPLSIPLLASDRFAPKANENGGIDAGVLQLPEGTVLVVDETAMGEGGQLNETAVENLKTLVECVGAQTLPYRYPYMNDLKIDCSIKSIVLSEGKSLIPVDCNIRAGQFVKPHVSEESLQDFRSYLANHGNSGGKVIIPDDTSKYIQDVSAEGRKAAPSAAEWTNNLKIRLKIARLLAQSHDEYTVTKEIWRRAVDLDEQVKGRR